MNENEPIALIGCAGRSYHAEVAMDCGVAGCTLKRGFGFRTCRAHRKREPQLQRDEAFRHRDQGDPEC